VALAPTVRQALDRLAPELWSDPRIADAIAAATRRLSTAYYRDQLTDAVVLFAAHGLMGAPMEGSRPGPDPVAPRFTSRRGALKGVSGLTLDEAQLQTTEYGRQLLALRVGRGGRGARHIAPRAS